MRILHTSDWHLGKSLYDFSLLDDQQYCLEHLLSLLHRERVDALVIAGDVYDRPIPSGGAVQLYDHFLSEAVGRLGIPVLAIAGNHDSGGRLEFGSSLYKSSGYYVVGQARAEIAKVTLTDRFGPVNFFLLPYLHPADARALFGEEEEVKTFDDAYRVLLGRNAGFVDPAQRNVVAAHGFFSNLSGKEEERELITSDSEISIGGMDIADCGCFSPFDYAALGHLHAPQRTSEFARYSGSPLKYSLSEERQQKSFTLLELGEKGSIRTEALPSPALRDVRTVRGAFGNLLDPAFHENQRFEDYVFADITGGSVLYPMEKLRTLFPRLLGLRFMDELPQGGMPEIRLGKKTPRLSVEELFRRFFADMKGYEIPDDHLALLRDVLAEMDKEEETQ